MLLLGLEGKVTPTDSVTQLMATIASEAAVTSGAGAIVSGEAAITISRMESTTSSGSSR